MSSREFIALGTASQVPTRYRNHNAYFLRWDEHGLLFDPGEGTQRQMTRSGLASSQLHHILITHFHGDHCLGLAGMIQRISLDSVAHPVHVHYPASGQVYFERLRRASIFHDKSDIRPCPIHKGGPIFSEDKLTVSTRKLSHGVPSWGFRLKEHDSRRMLPKKLGALGIRGPAVGELLREGHIEHEGRTVSVDEVSDPRPGQVFAFVMDTRICDNAFALAEGADLLVCESTYLSSEETEAIKRGHMTAAQAARIAKESGARRLVLTHFSQRYGDPQAFYDEARQIHDDVVVVSDGDRVKVPKRR